MLIKNKEEQEISRANVDTPRWIIKKLQNGEHVDQNVLDIVDRIRLKPKGPLEVGACDLDELLKGCERKVDIKISLSGEDCKEHYPRFFSGVGLIRSEYLIRKQMMWITAPEIQEIEKKYIENILTVFSGKEVWYRTIEVPTSWVNVLDGCDHVINERNDTVIGLRGIRRSLAFPETFMIEVSMLADLSRKYNNLNIIFPFVHDVSELKKAKEYLKYTGFNGKVGIMAEIPSTVLCLDEFLDEGVSKVVVGLNDLTSLTLGSKRSLSIYRNTHRAVVKLMEMAREKTSKYGVNIVLAGKHNPESIANADKLGFDAVTIFVPDIPFALKKD
jgi:signal transduction protein with GAF and PtsI domain